MEESSPMTASAPAPVSTPRNVAVGELRGAAGSLTFLTRLPLGDAIALDGEDLARSAPYFPLVGGAIGAIVGAIAATLATWVGPLLAAVVAVAAYAGLTGALHLDGVADTFDALGTPTRDDALRVMREPTIGAFGATALFLDLLLWTALLALLVDRPDFLGIVIAVGALSRLGPVLLLAALPYARPGGGAGIALSRGSRARAALAVGIALVVSVVLLGLAGLILAAVLALALIFLGLRFRAWIGGVTGDSLGCSIEILEIAGLSAAVALLAIGVIR